MFVITISLNRSWKLPLDQSESLNMNPQSLIHDQFVIVLGNSALVTVGHIPKFMCKLTYFFLKHYGNIKCEITGFKKYSKDLGQGGFEIPARLAIGNANKRMTDVMKKN